MNNFVTVFILKVQDTNTFTLNIDVFWLVGLCSLELFCDIGQWRTQEFFGGDGYTTNFFWVGVQQIQLRREGRENGDLGAVAP
jgi:hypothetical protein